MDKINKFLEKNALRKHRLYEYFRARRRWLPLYVVATYVGVSSTRMSQILCGHTPCPSWIDDKLDKLVDQVTILEENDGRGDDA